MSLSRIHDEIVGSIIRNATEERVKTRGEVIQLLEDLLANPKLGPRTVYEAIQREQSTLTRRIAERAFEAGLEEAKEPNEE